MKVNFDELKIKSSFTGKRNNKLVTFYVKDCDFCGNEFTTDKSKRKFCKVGCTKESQLEPLERFFKEKITRNRSNAKKRKIDFDLNWKDLKELYISQKGKCFYTGETMGLTYSSKTHKICPPNQLSVDRVDSSKGYFRDNIVLCCYSINNFKGDSSLMDFKEILRKILSIPVEVKFKKLTLDAGLPKYSKDGDAGLDLVCTSKNAVSGDERYLEYGTGLAVQIPRGYVGYLFPRSSLSKYELSMCNHVGVIDSGYRGEIKVRFKNTNGTPFYGKTYDIGDKVCQLVIMPIPLVLIEEVDELEDSSRGNGGFGSSGK